MDCYLEAYHQVSNKAEKDMIAQVQENPKIIIGLHAIVQSVITISFLSLTILWL